MIREKAEMMAWFIYSCRIYLFISWNAREQIQDFLKYLDRTVMCFCKCCVPVHKVHLASDSCLIQSSCNGFHTLKGWYYLVLLIQSEVFIQPRHFGGFLWRCSAVLSSTERGFISYVHARNVSVPIKQAAECNKCMLFFNCICYKV